MIRECSRACTLYMACMPCAIPLCDACIAYYTGGFFSGDFYKIGIIYVKKTDIIDYIP